MFYLKISLYIIFILPCFPLVLELTFCIISELPKLQIIDKNNTRSCTRKEAESMYCVGCFKEQKQVMFNCGHKMTCQNCSTLYFSCPYCHTAVTKRVITFV